MAQISDSSGEFSFSNLLQTLREIEDYTSVSLTQYTKKCTINSRTFIQRECSDCEALPDTMRVMMNLYTGLILTAVNMNMLVNDSHTIRDMMSIVATEALKNPAEMYYTAQELLKGYADSGELVVPMQPKMLVGDFDSIESTQKEVDATSGGKIIEYPREVDIPSGRIIEVKFGDPRKASVAALTAHLYLQLTPTFIPAEVAYAFVGCNFTPSIRQRWMQMKTGDISFWKDFLFAQDLRKRRRAALRKDTSGTLAEMFERQQNAVSNAWLKYVTFYREKQNIANTILIFDKYTFDRACAANGLDFKRYGSRQSFFNKTFAMMVAVIDQSYNRVETYFHGVESKGEYTFTALKNNAKNDKYDLTDIMKAYGQGMAPKF